MATSTTKQASERDGRSTEKKGTTAKVGNLTHDVELSYSPNGTAIAHTGLAVERPKETGNWAGERVTNFYSVSLFGSVAENAAACLRKGMRVIVVGNAELQHWKDKDGTERTGKQIAANAIGPDLRWATAQVAKVTRKGPGTEDGPGAGPEEDEEF